MKVRNSLKGNLEAASAAVRKAAEQKPAFIALPEYFSVPNNMEQFTSAEKISKETYNATIMFLAEISKEFPNIYVLGGTVLEENNGVFYNTSTLWKNGALIGKYQKRNPINAELKAGVIFLATEDQAAPPQSFGYSLFQNGDAALFHFDTSATVESEFTAITPAADDKAIVTCFGYTFTP